MKIFVVICIEQDRQNYSNPFCGAYLYQDAAQWEAQRLYKQTNQEHEVIETEVIE